MAESNNTNFAKFTKLTFPNKSIFRLCADEIGIKIKKQSGNMRIKTGDPANSIAKGMMETPKTMLNKT